MSDQSAPDLPLSDQPGVPADAVPIAGSERFPLGRLLATPGAVLALVAADASPVALLARHAAGDWGDLDAEDHRENARALRAGHRLLSAYTLPTGVTLWAITEADRSATTLLLPGEY